MAESEVQILELSRTRTSDLDRLSTCKIRQDDDLVHRVSLLEQQITAYLEAQTLISATLDKCSRLEERFLELKENFGGRLTRLEMSTFTNNSLSFAYQ